MPCTLKLISSVEIDTKEGTSTQALYCDQSKMYMTKHKQEHFNQQGPVEMFLTAS